MPTWPQFASIEVTFVFQAEDGIRGASVTGVQTCALPIWVQPHFFDAPLLAFVDREATATIWIAALDPRRHQQDGLACEITFASTDRCAVLADRSELYRCNVHTAHSPTQLAIGARTLSHPRSLTEFGARRCYRVASMPAHRRASATVSNPTS